MLQQILDAVVTLRHDVDRRLDRLEAKLDALILGEALMNQQLADIITALDAETTTLASKLDKLTADLQAAIAANQTPTAEQLATLSSISDRLKALGADPSNPIPAPAPAPTPDPTPTPIAPVDPTPAPTT